MTRKKKWLVAGIVAFVLVVGMTVAHFTLHSGHKGHGETGAQR